MEGPRASVIIPSWNACDVLVACLDSLEAQRLEGGFETIVVDNASTDGTAELLRRRGSRVRTITNERNVDFSAANNQAAAEAAGRVLVFLNSDTELLAPDTLERLVSAAEAPGVAIAGPKLVNPDGSLQPSCAAHPSVGRALLVGAGLHRLLPDRLLARAAPHEWSHDRSIETDWVKGAAMAMRRDLFHEVGGFWPGLYGEEQDLAYRAQARGGVVRFENGARVMHLGNHSNAQRMDEAERARRVASAELAFLSTHYPRRRAAAIRAITGCAFAARAAAHGLLRHEQRASVYRSMAKVYAAGGRD